MREAVYLVFVVSGAVSPGAGEAYKPRPNGPERHGVPARLDLSTPAFDIPSPFELGQGTPPAPRGRASSVPDLRFGPSPCSARGALASGLSAGRSLVAAAVVFPSALTGRAARPVGGAVPSTKAPATISTTVKKSNFPVLNVNPSLARNRQLDASAGGTYPDCAVGFDASAAAGPKLALRAPCDGAGHFGAALRGEF